MGLTMSHSSDASPESPEHAERLVKDFDHWDFDLAQNPFPIYQTLREQCPVAHSDRHGGYFVLSRYVDIDAVARNHEVFSSHSISVPPIGANAAENTSPPLDLDPPKHTRFRQALLPYFSPGRTRKLEAVTRTAAARLVEQIATHKRSDVAEEFAKHLPITVLASVLGVDERDEPLFTEWTDAIVSGGSADRDASTRASSDIRDYFRRLIHERRSTPQDDLISFLAQAEGSDGPISESDQVGAAALLLVAGIDTTWCMLGNSLWYLAQDAEARQRLVADPGLMSTAVEEFLRRFAPVSVVRITTCPVEIAEQEIPEGTHVLLPLVAANLDPAVFAEPYDLQLDRLPNRHLAFGAGVHRCIGAHLARMELRVGLEEFIRRLPDFQLDGPDAVAWKPGPIRGPSRLVLSFGS
jgi:cytochrome P450